MAAFGSAALRPISGGWISTSRRNHTPRPARSERPAEPPSLAALGFCGEDRPEGPRPEPDARRRRRKRRTPRDAFEDRHPEGSKARDDLRPTPEPSQRKV